MIACTSATPIQVSQSGKGAYEAALASGDDGFLVAWHDTRDGNAEVYVRPLDGDGRPSGPERRLTESPGASYEASLERFRDGFAVAWYEQSADGERTAMLGRWSGDGTRRWIHSLAPSSRNPVIRTRGPAIFCAWLQTEAGGAEAVWAGWWDEDGNEQRARVVLGPASANTWNLNAALDRSGAGWVVFDAVSSTRSSELFLARVDASGVRLERLTSDDGVASKYPDLAIADDDRAALTWYDARDGNEEVYLLTTSASELGGEIDRRARRVTTTPGESVGAYLAWNAERVGLAWSDRTVGQHEVFFQAFDRSGTPVGDAWRVTRNGTWSLVPSIRPWGDGFALAWNEYAPASAATHDGTSEVAFMLVR